MTNAEKNKFRQTKAWKDFREEKIAEVKKLDPKGKLRCQLSGVPLRDKQANCHHLDETNYTDLQLHKFKILSSTMHTLVEFMALVLNGKNPVPFREQWMALLGPFLPRVERTVDKLMSDISIRAEYNKALGSGMFFVLHPDLTGIWEDDREEWMAWLRTEKGGVNA